MKNNFNKICMCLKPFRNGLSIFLGILFLGLMNCSNATEYTSSSPTGDKTPDTTPPSVTISTNKSLEIDKTGTITFAFSEEVTNFTPNDVRFSSDDFSVNDIVIGNFITNNPKEYSLDITPKTNGTLTISIPTNSFEDLSGNQNTDSFSTNFSVEDKTPPTEDKTPPSVTISTNKSLEIDKTGTITFAFSEEVTNFTPNDVRFSSDDFSVNDIVIGNFITNNPKEYSLDITPKTNGTLTISIPTNSFEDLSGNQNTDSFSNNFSVEDKTPPTVNISSDTLIEGTSAFLSFTFSEKVNNFTPDDIQFLTNKANGVNAEKGNFITNSQKSYSLEITPETNSTLTNGTLYVSIQANSFYDLSANQNDKPYSNSFTVLDSSTAIHTISFKLNGGSFISSQITTLKVVDNTAIEETRLGGILSYPPTGPKPSIQAVTRDIFEWRNNGTKYDLSTLVRSDLTLEAVWSNSCGKVETFHPANRNAIKNYVDNALRATNLNHIDTSAITDMNKLFYSSSFNGEIGCWNVAKVNNMREMFRFTHVFNQDISSWNVANVTNMREMFKTAYAFNQDISSWSVANVTNMNGMFDNANAFNQDIGSWNVANVNNMGRMFDNAYAFNQDISSWNVANVTSMNGMFSGASAFSQDISSWNVANANNMGWMFSSATNFDQDISSWNTANVTDMTSMFRNAYAFNQDLSGWDVDKVTYYVDIFTGSAIEEKNKPAKFRAYFTISFNLNGGMFQSPQTNLIVSKGDSISQAALDKIQVNYPDVGPKEGVSAVSREFLEWRVAGVKYNNSTITSDMILQSTWSNSCGAVETVHPTNRGELQNYINNAITTANPSTNLNHIDTSAITNMNNLFNGKTSFNGDIDCWNTANVINMTGMFNGAAAFNQNISNWNVANVTDMSSMFFNAKAFNQNLSSWSVNNVTNYDNIFTGGSAMVNETNKHPVFNKP